ncbi:MAG: hypothetical protein GX327_01225, partial [Epulopiscium sp.]|nr:hypothetical protein [Candidatus Epulonipiscium sp.]
DYDDDNLLFSDEDKSSEDDNYDDESLDFENKDFEFNYDGEEKALEDEIEDSYGFSAKDESEEAETNEYESKEYGSSFGSFFDDIGVEKNSEQDLIDKVLKDIQAADGGSDYDDMGMEFSKKNNIFERKQTKYLSGKRVSKDIRNEHGEIIARSGQVIDEKIIKIAKKQGKLIELIMNSN